MFLVDQKEKVLVAGKKKRRQEREEHVYTKEQAVAAARHCQNVIMPRNAMKGNEMEVAGRQAGTARSAGELSMSETPPMPPTIQPRKPKVFPHLVAGLLMDFKVCHACRRQCKSPGIKKHTRDKHNAMGTEKINGVLHPHCLSSCLNQ